MREGVRGSESHRAPTGAPTVHAILVRGGCDAKSPIPGQGRRTLSPQPVMRVVFTIIGAIFGLGLADGPHELFGLLLGGGVGFGLAELSLLRARLKQLETEVAELRRTRSAASTSATLGSAAAYERPTAP